MKSTVIEFDSSESLDSLTDEYMCWHDWAERQKTRNPDLTKKLKLSHNLIFEDEEAEKKYRHYLNTYETLQSSFVIILIFFVLMTIAGFRDFFQYLEWYNPDQLWAIGFLRAIWLVYALVLMVLFSWVFVRKEKVPPKIHHFVMTHQHALYFSLICLDALVFSGFLFFYHVELGLPWGPHACSLFAQFSTTRLHWPVLALYGLAQIIIFAACGVLAGYKSDTVFDASIYLIIFGIIGFVGMWSRERWTRTVFSQQEISLVILHRNAKALKDLAQQARQAVIAKSCFVANISHEIRTPLHGVITALDLLKSTGELTPEQSDYVEVAEMSSGLLLDILNNVLSISKLQAEKVVLDCLPIDLRSLIDSVCVVFCQIAAKKGVEVAAFIPPECPVHLLSDAVHLKQVLFNLVSNAVKFTPKGSVLIRVNVDSETERDVSLSITVQDTGIGVAKESLHLMFQRFSQVDQSSTRRFQGTGLGLALVFEFSKLFGGTATVSSEGLGQGTTFTFSATFLKNNRMLSAGGSGDLRRYSQHLISHSPSPRPLLTDLVSNRLVLSAFSAEWISLVMHPLPAIGEMWSAYLRHLGFDSTQLCSPVHVPSLSWDLKSRLEQSSTLAQSEGGRHHFLVAPFVLMLDHSLCCVPSVQTLLTAIPQELSETQQNSDRRLSALGGHIRHPLIAIVVGDPVQIGEPDTPQLKEWQVHHIKKPVTLQKLSELIQTIFKNLCNEATRRESLTNYSNLLFPHAQNNLSGGDQLSSKKLSSTSELEALISPDMRGSSVPQSRLLNSFISDQPMSTIFSTPLGVEAQGGVGSTELGSPPSLLISQTAFDTSVLVPTIKNEKEKEDVSKKILVVDDNDINRKLTERLLTKAGFQCTCVTNGLEAVEMATSQQFAVIFMDITMPVMDGCTATRLIHEHEIRESTERRTLICALSAADTEKFEDAPFDAILIKPVKQPQLVKTAQELSSSIRLSR